MSGYSDESVGGPTCFPPRWCFWLETKWCFSGYLCSSESAVTVTLKSMEVGLCPLSFTKAPGNSHAQHSAGPAPVPSEHPWGEHRPFPTLFVVPGWRTHPSPFSQPLNDQLSRNLYFPSLFLLPLLFILLFSPQCQFRTNAPNPRVESEMKAALMNKNREHNVYSFSQDYPLCWIKAFQWENWCCSLAPGPFLVGHFEKQ